MSKEIKLEFGTTPTETAAPTAETVEKTKVAAATEVTENAAANADKPAEIDPKLVETYAASLNLLNRISILNYGAQTQRLLSGFTIEAVRLVLENNTTSVKNIIVMLTEIISDFDTETEHCSTGIRQFLRHTKPLRERYAEINEMVDELQKQLLGQQNALKVELQRLNETKTRFDKGRSNLDALIEGGRAKLKATQDGELKELQTEITSTGQSEQITKYNTLQSGCDSLAERLENLALTKTVASQTLAQIELTTAEFECLVKSIQNCIENEIPSWQNHVALALHCQDQATKVDAQDLASVKNHNAQLLSKMDEMFEV